MAKLKTVTYRFVQTMPDVLEPAILYVSTDHGVALHLCCCGCGNEVVTAIAPEEWKVIFDGATVSLYPSIGNFKYRCRSHYWIWNNNVIWDHKLSRRSTTAQLSLQSDTVDAMEIVESGWAPRSNKHSLWRRLLRRD